MKHNKKIALLLILAVQLLFLLIVTQQCTTKTQTAIKLPEGKTSKIIFIIGDVYVKTQNSGWQKAELGQILPEGVSIKTSENSFCEIAISSGAVFRLKDNTVVQLVALTENSQNNRSKLKLINGTILSKVKRITYKSTLNIETTTTTLGIRGTEFYVETKSNKDYSNTKLMVHQGKVNVKLNLNLSQAMLANPHLKSIKNRIYKGVNVRGGYKIEIDSKKISKINSELETLATKEEVTKAQLQKIKEEITPIPKQLTQKEWEQLNQLKDLTVNFKQGKVYYVSPNFDGIKDSFIFSTEPYRDEKILGWKLVILDSEFNTEKVIRSRIGEKQKKGMLPDKIEWNMVNKEGKVIPDGNYLYEFYTLNKKGFYELREKGAIIVDTKPPYFSYKLENTMFSPNGDNIKDYLNIQIDAEKNISWTCTITTPEGIIVKNFEWKNSIPSLFAWDGKGDNGEVLPEGVYIITFKGTDKAGNTTTIRLNEITLDTRQRQASVDIDHPIFSPNGDGKLDTVTFYPILSDKYRIDTWDFIIQTEKGETARRFRGRRYVPQFITWDGKPQKGKVAEEYPNGLPSGIYYYFLKVIYRSGVNTYSFKKALTLDVTPPKISLDVEPKLFSPDGDGKDDYLIIKPKIEDLTPIIGWQAKIYTSSGKLFKTFKGVKLPEESFSWDGISDDGTLVDSGEDYYIVFEATDSAYNTGISEKVPFSIDILVIPTDRGLKIRVSNIEFGFNNANLKGDKTFQILNKIVKILKKYKKYSVIIEGHTDSTGNENYNIELSKKRAEAVGKYLIEHGIDPKRLSYRGYGSQYPIDTNETKEGRARNRRVEFILIKK